MERVPQQLGLIGIDQNLQCDRKILAGVLSAAATGGQSSGDTPEQCNDRQQLKVQLFSWQVNLLESLHAHSIITPAVFPGAKYSKFKNLTCILLR